MVTGLRRGLQYGAHLFLGDWEFQHGMDREQRQQLADMRFLTGLHNHNNLRLGCNGLQGSQGDIQI